MSKGRISREEKARQRLLDLWRGEDEFGEPIGCVATTFTFEADFFEEQCLGRFLRMDTDAAEHGREYLIEHETRLSETFACVLVDERHAKGSRSLRWHLLPVRVPGAILHAKIAILQWHDCVRVLVGSANLTVPGYRSNFENLAVLDFRPSAGPPRSILLAVIECLQAIQNLSPGANRNEGPHKSLGEFLQGVEAKARTWTGDDQRREEPGCTFVWLAQGRPSLFSAMAELWSGAPANYARVVSPFFNGGADARKASEALEQNLLIQRGSCNVHFVAPGHRAANGAIELQAPAALRQGARDSVRHSFAFVNDGPSEDPKEHRALHAKSLWAERDGHVLYAMGSSNFTVNGTGLAASPNLEANLVYDIPEAANEFRRLCWAASPPMQEVDLDADRVEFLYDPEDRGETDAGDDCAPLPGALGSALLAQEGGVRILKLELLAEPPSGFTVTYSGGVLLDSAQVAAGRFPDTYARTLSGSKPPASLDVTWPANGMTMRAVWVVNAADVNVLPPPEELCQLSLEELLQVLTSARPYHAVIAQLIRAREAKERLETGAVVDPHKKVDTSNYLMRRMKRFSLALEGLRERMLRAVFSLDTLAWRLRGPLGPLALAKRLQSEEGDAAGFMIAELAATLAAARPPLGEGMDGEAAEREMKLVLRELVHMAKTVSAPPNLAQYVQHACEEVLG